MVRRQVTQTLQPMPPRATLPQPLLTVLKPPLPHVPALPAPQLLLQAWVTSCHAASWSILRHSRAACGRCALSTRRRGLLLVVTAAARATTTITAMATVTTATIPVVAPAQQTALAEGPVGTLATTTATSSVAAVAPATLAAPTTTTAVVTASAPAVATAIRLSLPSL